MTQLRIKELLGRANLILDKGFHCIPGFVMIKGSEMEAILDRIDASIPEDIKDAESILRRKEEIQIEANQRAEKIIMDARAQAEKILSESELLNQVQREAEKIKEQVLTECQEHRERTLDESKQIKMQAEDEAIRTKEGAENYAEQILNNIENDLSQLHHIVKNAQLVLSSLRKDSGSAAGAYNSEQITQSQVADDYTSAYYQ